jgi:branched-chain amino acid transport system substrate-binding protein
MVRKITITGLVAVLLVAVVFAFAGCGEDTTTTTAVSTETTGGGTETTGGAATGEPIKIGVLGSMTGTAAPAFPAIQKGYELEITNLNATGGINGRPIELITVDDKSDPATAVSVATKLITQDNVVALLGPLSTPCALAVQPLAEQYEIPLLRWDTPTLDSPATNTKWDFICSVGPVDVANALEAQIAAEGWKKIVGAADILPPNYQALEILEQDAASQGFEIIVLEDTWQLDATDLTPQINKIYAAYEEHDPDVLFVLSAIVQTPVLTKGLKDLGVTVPIQSGAVSGHPGILSMGPEAVEDLLFIGAGVINPEQLPDDFPSKEVMLDFATRYQAAYNEATSLFAGLGYDSAHILFEGLKVGVDDKAKIRDAIEGIKDLPISQGVVTYAPDDHQLHGGYNEWIVKSGVFNFVRTLN